jgi:hypothetical protein
MQQVPLEQRLAAQLLQHPVAQQFSWRTVNLLLAVERGDADLDDATVRQLLRAALTAVITSEVMSARQASAPADSQNDAAEVLPSQEGLL